MSSLLRRSTTADLAVLTAAIKCSIATYDLNTRPLDHKLAFETIHSIPASTSGVIKATNFTRVSVATPSLSPADGSLPALVVAVRGSMKMIDWVVNANHEIRDAQELFVATSSLPRDCRCTAHGLIARPRLLPNGYPRSGLTRHSKSTRAFGTAPKR